MDKKNEIKKMIKRVENHTNLNEKEKEIILSKLESGKEFGFETGYSSIDRNWMKYFNIDKYHNIQNDKTIYQDILKMNEKYLSNLAIMYFGGKITYKKLFDKINEVSKSFEEYGIKKGDYVTICCAGIPECIYSVYALAKIGAVANLMPPYFDKKQMTERISDCESKTLIVLDSFYPQIKDSIINSTIEKIIVIPTLNSSPLRFISKKGSIKLNYINELWWNQFIKDGKKKDTPETFKYEKDYPLCMVYSSGTTGASKAIVLSHDSFQYSVLSYDANTVELHRGQKLYQIVPPWYSTGLSTSVHLPLHRGLTIFQDPRFERDIFVKNIVDSKIDISIGPTSMYEGFLDEKLMKGKKFSHFYTPVQGGEALKEDLKNKIEYKLEQAGVKTKILVAYGQCECGAQATSQSQNINHPANSVGIPIPGVDVTIMDDNYNELPYGKRGNIVVNTPCGMLGYYKRTDATEKYFYYDKCGERWNCTGDIGSMDKDGNLFVDGRAEDFTIIDGVKIYNFDIENSIIGMPDIKNCDCIAKRNDDGTNELGIHIIFTEESKFKYNDPELLLNKLSDIQKTIFKKYNNIKMVPQCFKIRDSFPYKPSGKRDVESLSDETDGFIYIDNSYLLDKVKIKKK